MSCPTSNCFPQHAPIPSNLPPWSRPVQELRTQTIVGNDTVDLTVLTSYLKQNVGGPFTVVLPNGTVLQQQHHIYVNAGNFADTSEFLVTGAFAGFTSLKFTTIGQTAVLEWLLGNKWGLVAGNAEIIP